MSVAGAMCLLAQGCASAPGMPSSRTADAAPPNLAQIYYWRARPGKSADYSRYIREVAEPIDREAQRAGAFLDVTTYAVSDTTLPFTHMRIFVLRDSAQLLGLGAALAAAGVRMQPDTARRRLQGEYAATLRDRVAATEARMVR